MPLTLTPLETDSWPLCFLHSPLTFLKWQGPQASTVDLLLLHVLSRLLSISKTRLMHLKYLLSGLNSKQTPYWSISDTQQPLTFAEWRNLVFKLMNSWLTKWMKLAERPSSMQHSTKDLWFFQWGITLLNVCPSKNQVWYWDHQQHINK